MQAVLVMFRSDGGRRSFSIARDMTVIGRREDCDLRIPLGDVSRKHCRLVRDADALRLEDLGSSNGTYHNGQRVDKEVPLSAGDSIQVGPVVFVLQVDGTPADDDLHPITVENADGGGMQSGGDERSDRYADLAGPLPDGEPVTELEHIESGEGEPLEALETLESLEQAEATPSDEAPSNSTDHLDAIDIVDEQAGH